MDNTQKPMSKDQQAILRSLKIWKIVAIVASILAISMAGLVIWQNFHRSVITTRIEPTAQQSVLTKPCPRLPPTLPLPKPLPNKIKEVFEQLENKVKSLVDKEHKLPAISMNVFYQDDVLWSGHFGSKVYKQTQDIPDDNTVYRIGSVTKIFAVLLMWKLYEEGKISSIDDPLNKYAPDFDITNPFTDEHITLREIASQMSGLPREAPCMFTCNTTSADQLALLRNRTLVLPPWTMPSYSNLGYALLGRLLTENSLNQTFENWTTENILKPLGMNNTGFEITDDVQRNMAFPYGKDGTRIPFMDVGWLAPAGQMYSTINDMAKLGMFLAQPDKQNLFKPATLREMLTPVEIAPDRDIVWGSPFEMLSLKEGLLVRGKLGYMDSYLAYFSVIPELQLGVNLLVSATSFLESSGTPDLPFSIGELTYQLLLPELNSTLTEEQKKAPFPIPRPRTRGYSS
ncbi:Putative beta-lactamase-like 1 [Desmophyllum pertusum]|uniref:Beta-lactamase-like 1 n=1 Tax=Desmophyllum pertusum TaxID=174260 RepID=A0A9W9ZAP1_9CNID|nr:Putative beta-lactamase-like 1 [Desmophyllum pertusum]